MHDRTLIVKEIIHRQEKVFGLYFEYDAKIISLLKNTTEARWSQSLKCWYIPAKNNLLIKVEKELEKHIPVDKSQLSISSKKEFIIHPACFDSFIRWMKNKRYSERTISVYADAIQVFFKFNKKMLKK